MHQFIIDNQFLVTAWYFNLDITQLPQYVWKNKMMNNENM